MSDTPHRAMGDPRVPLWVSEFGTGYAVPDIIGNDDRLTDTSWHNDVCPSFMLKGTEGDDGPRIWIAHPDKEQREFPEMPRLQVCNTFTFVWESENDDDAATAIDMLIAERSKA